MYYVFSFFVSDTFGTNFAFVFPYRRFSGAVPYVVIINQAMSSTDVTLWDTSGTTYTRTLTSTGNDRDVEIIVPSGVTLPKVNGLHSNKMLRVEATGPVSVVGGFKGGVTSGETFTVLPTNTLGKFYIVPSYDNGNAPPNGYSFLIVSALNANTQINIELGGQTVTRTLTNQYDSYQVLAGLTDFPAATDLTGTLVHADQPVVVISGHAWGQVPLNRNAFDAMVEQVQPLSSLGIRYVLTPFLTHVNGYSYRIIATLCETMITITPTVGSPITVTLQPGNFTKVSAQLFWT